MQQASEHQEALALIAFDGSCASHRALASVSRLLTTGRVAVLTVWEERMTPALGFGAAGVGPVDQGMIDEIERDRREHADQISRSGATLARSLGLDAVAIAKSESPSVADTILSTAREEQASVIVAGTHGLGGALSRLMGGTCSALIDGADCPVLIVREETEG